ncbi:hypothetical protein [Acidocella sp.]|nr:hypothetical protein [Acidocella sp.]
MGYAAIELILNGQLAVWLLLPPPLFVAKLAAMMGGGTGSG